MRANDLSFFVELQSYERRASRSELVQSWSTWLGESEQMGFKAPTCMSKCLPKREELLLRTVLALPMASMIGLVDISREATFVL